MATHPVDLSTWPRAAQYRLFRSFDKPHYAITVRCDLTHVMARKPEGVSPYRACLFAIGTGIHAVPELRMRFRGDTVVQHDQVSLSMPVPRAGGGFSFGYVPYDPDFARFDRDAERLIAEAAASTELNPNDTNVGDAVVYASCLPWLDFSALDNAMPNADDCIPRVSWGKVVPEPGGYRAAMSIQVHHALADGEHLGTFFETVQTALNAV